MATTYTAFLCLAHSCALQALCNHVACGTPGLFQPRLLAALVAAPSSRLPQPTEQHAFARLARGQTTRTTRRQGSRVSPRGARSLRRGQWPVVACTRVRVPWCDALSRPVAHSASSRTAHGYTLVIHTRAVEITREVWWRRGEQTSRSTKLARPPGARAPSWRTCICLVLRS